MDWTSLTEPACLSITTDYYPDESSISRDYLYYPSLLVINNLIISLKVIRKLQFYKIMEN